MDFNFSVNAIFKEKLSKVGSNMVPSGYAPDRRGDGDVVTKVSSILDKMGIVSGKAQKLPGPITSASKLRNSDHVVYVLTDPEGNRGHGSVIGILKIGLKKLFIYDTNGTQWEMMPLCVLDFYVHETKQRAGFGRMLFDFMLQDRNVLPQHLALDQPSESFLSFMFKHYALDSIIPQIYNFVVYDSFFKGRTDNYRCTSGASSASSGNNSRPSQKAIASSVQCVKATGVVGDNMSLPTYGRHSAKKAGSTMAEYMRDGSAVTSNGTSEDSYTKFVHSKYLTPTALKSSLGQILKDDDVGETLSENHVNGEMSTNPKQRKISNIPIGNDVEEGEFQPRVVGALHFKQNGNPHIYSLDGIRDVRIKKTDFKNLSPFRK